MDKNNFSDEEIKKTLDSLVEKGLLVEFWSEDDQEMKWITPEDFNAKDS